MSAHSTTLPGPRSPRPRQLLRVSLYLTAIFLFCLGYWLNRYFGKPEIEQIAYHLNAGVDGLLLSDPALIRRCVRWCVVAPLLFLALLLLAERKMREKLTSSPRLLGHLHGKLPPVLLLAAIVYWLVQLSAFDYAASAFGPDYFVAHYVQPGSVQLGEQQPKNLILIYVESLEAGYSDRTVFGRDLLAPLTALEGSHFDAYQQAPGTGWTIAAMVATQCGVPLKRVTIYENNRQGEKLRTFLPNATCLPDILAQHGYRNVFMGGASPVFAGKGKFLKTHHYDEIYGKEDWQRSGVAQADMNGWGLYDDELFSRARTKLRQLEAAHQHFNLTLLTVDTHEPEGHLSKGCAQRGYSNFDGVIACTAQDLARFVRFVKDSGYLADTNIVIVGDHLGRKDPLSEQLGQLPQRTIYNAFIGASTPVKNREQLVHFDMLPTILEFNGFTVAGGRLGLGYSAFNHHRAHPEAQRLAEMQASLMNRSDAYLALWTGQAH